MILIISWGDSQLKLKYVVVLAPPLLLLFFAVRSKLATRPREETRTKAEVPWGRLKDGLLTLPATESCTQSPIIVVLEAMGQQRCLLGVFKQKTKTNSYVVLIGTDKNFAKKSNLYKFAWSQGQNIHWICMHPNDTLPPQIMPCQQWNATGSVSVP